METLCDVLIGSQTYLEVAQKGLSMNLYDLCINKGFFDVVAAWDDDTPMNEVSPQSHKKYKLKCPKCGTVKMQNLAHAVNSPNFKFRCVSLRYKPKRWA